MSKIFKRLLDGAPKPSGIKMRERSTEEQALYGHWKYLKVVHGILYRVDTSGLKLIIPTIRVNDLLEQIHQQLSHAGQLRTEAPVRQRY